MSANRPAGAAGEDSDEYSEATDDQKRDEERAQRKQRQREWPHSFRVVRPKDFLKTVLKVVLRPEDFLETVLKAVLWLGFCWKRSWKRSWKRCFGLGLAWKR